MAVFETLLKGRMLGGRYLVQELLGRGGMGAVFRARDDQLDRLVALKVLNFADSPHETEENLRKRFRREAKVAAKLKHRNVVAIYDRGVDAVLDLDYIVMELLPGVDLARYLAGHGSVPPRVALIWLRQAARGVAAGHRAGLIHRDIKPANLFLAEEEGDDARVVILDFGVALPTISDQTLTRLTLSDRGPHTLAYAAPEQLTGAVLTPACDVFSLAATAFELFTGTRMAPPGEPAGSEASITRARGVLSRPEGPIPATIAEVLDRALSLNPNERYRDAIEFASVLAAVNIDSWHEAPATVTEPANPRPPVFHEREDINGGQQSTVLSQTDLVQPLFRAEAPRYYVVRSVLAWLAMMTGILSSFVLAGWIFSMADPRYWYQDPPRPDLMWLLVVLELSVAFVVGWGTSRIAVVARRAFATATAVLWIVWWGISTHGTHSHFSDTPNAWIYTLVVMLGGCLCVLAGGRTRRTASHGPVVAPKAFLAAYTMIWIPLCASICLVVIAILTNLTNTYLEQFWELALILSLVVFVAGCIYIIRSCLRDTHKESSTR